MPPTKRPAIVTSSGGGIKRRRTAVGGAVRVARAKKITGGKSSASAAGSDAKNNPLYDDFIQLLSAPQYKGKGIANSTLKSHFGDAKYPELVSDMCLVISAQYMCVHIFQAYTISNFKLHQSHVMMFPLPHPFRINIICYQLGTHHQ